MMRRWCRDGLDNVLSILCFKKLTTEYMLDVRRRYRVDIEADIEADDVPEVISPHSIRVHVPTM